MFGGICIGTSNFEVSDREDDVTSKGVESSIGGNRVTSCKKGCQEVNSLVNLQM